MTRPATAASLAIAALAAASVAFGAAHAQVADDFEPSFDFDAEMESFTSALEDDVVSGLADELADVSDALDSDYDAGSVFASALSDEEGDLLVPEDFADASDY